MLICDENGNSISKLDYGKVYYSSAYITYQLLTLINDTNETLILTTDCFTAEEYPASIKLIEINNLNDCEVDCIRMLLELPQFDLMIPPMSKIHVRAYLVFNFTSEDLFAYSDHKRVGGTSYFRISMTLVFKSKTLSHNIDSILTIHASACNSLLSADDTEIEFDSCLVGNTYVRDVQIWNRSECVLLYRIMPHGGKTSGKLPVSFSDFETGKVINLYEQLSIPAFSSQRLRITLKAKVPCEVVRSIRFENDYNSSNIVVLHCRISVIAKELTDDLVLETESGMQISGPIDFGDCYNGYETSRKVWLRNNSQDTVEVSVTSDSSMICFDYGTEKEKYLEKSLPIKNSIPNFERDSSVTTLGHHRFELEEDEISPLHWIPSSQSSRDNRDRTGKEILKFQSKEHRYTSNYFGIDEFSGDFKDDELCPGSAFRYQRYFNSKISSTSRHLKSSKVQVDPTPTSRGGSIIDSVPIPSKRYHDSEVIVLPPGTRRQIIIKLIPTVPDYERSRSINPIVQTKIPLEDIPLDESILGKTRSEQRALDGVFTRRMMKIQLSWKKLLKISTSERFDLKQKQKVYMKGIPTRARCCTSLISISHSTFDLGECSIGELKSGQFTITNESDLPAVILPTVESGSIELLEKEISIPPRQSKLCHFEFVARAVEDNYSKRITLLNLFNSHSNIQVEIRAKTIDTHQVLEHSALYKITTKNNKKQLQVFYENCLSNMPNIRTFTLQNVCQKDLTFHFTVPQSSDLELYSLNSKNFYEQKPKKISSKSTSNFSSSTSSSMVLGNSSVDLESGLEIEKTRRINSNSMKPNTLPGRNIRRSSSFGNEMDLLQQDKVGVGLGETEKKSDENQKLEMKKFESLGLDDEDFMTFMDSSGFPFAFLENIEEKKDIPDLSLRQYQANQVIKAITRIDTCFRDLNKELQTAAQFHHIGNGRLKPLCTASILSNLVIPVGGYADIVVILTPKAKPIRNEEDAADVQMLTREIKLNVSECDDSDTSLQTTTSRSLKSRSIIVRARVFESEMVINQKNINFGKTVVGELSTRGLSITNKSPIPLLYSIAKSGSISSLFLTVSNNHEKGIIRALSSKTIEFAFKPNLSGQYEETLILENVLNTMNSQAIVIKANVLKQQLFELLTVDINPLLLQDDEDTGTSSATTMVPGLAEIEIEIQTFLNSKLQETLSISPLPIFYLGVLQGGSKRQSSSFQFKILNISTKPRTFLIEFIQFELSTIDNYVELQYSYHVINQLEQSKLGLTGEERKYLEDKLEKLSQKLVIAKRKENTEKILKYEKKISDLKSKLELDNKQIEVPIPPPPPPPPSSTTTPAGVGGGGAGENAGAASAPTGILINLDESGKLSFSLSPEEAAVVTVTISATLKRPAAPNQPLPACGMLKIYEGKNRDDVKYVYFGTTFLPSIEEIGSLSDKLQSDLPESRSVEDLELQASRPLLEKDSTSRPFFIEVEDTRSFNSRKYYPRYRTSMGVILKKGLELIRQPSDPSSFFGEFSIISEGLETTDLYLSVIDDPLLSSPSECSNLFGTIQGSWKINLIAQTWSNSLTLANSLKEELRVSLTPGEKVTCQLTWTIPTEIRELFTGLICVKLIQSMNIDKTDSKIIPVLCNTFREANIITEKHVLFGEIQLGKVYSYNLTLRNKSNTEDVHYTTQIVTSTTSSSTSSSTTSSPLDSLQIVTGGVGIIPPNGIAIISLAFDAKFLGKFDYILHVTNILSNSSVAIAINATVTLPQSKFVVYPDIECDEAGKSNKLDIGFIQIPVIKPNDYEYKCQFRILNTSNEVLLVSALSNLKKQVLIYSDNECTNMTSYFPLDIGVITSLTIVIRPANLPLDGAEVGRELIGGIRFIYFTKDSSKDGADEEICRKVYESSVNFKAIVGRSKLRIAPCCTQFLCSRFEGSMSAQNGLIKGYLTLENISPTFPLHYQLPGIENIEELSSSKEIRKKNPHLSRVKFAIFDGCKGLIPPSSKKKLKFAVLLDDISGVMIKTLSFENTLTAEIETLELKFFFDSRAILSYYPSPSQPEIYLPNNRVRHLPGLLYSQGFFVTELSSKKISTPIWIAPFTSKTYSSNQKISVSSNDPLRSTTLLPEVLTQESIYITTGGEPVVLFEWKITNPSKHALRIAPASDLPITVSFEASSHSTEIKQIYMMPAKRSSKNESLKIGTKSKLSQTEEQRGSMTSLPRDLQKRGFAICGDITTVPPYSTMTVKVGYKKGQPLNASHYQHLLLGERNSLSSVSVAGGITFISAAQSLQSFFHPGEREEISTHDIESETCPVIHFTPVTCSFVVPSLKIINTQINLGLLRSYKPYYFTLEVENLSNVDIPFRVENLSTWMFVLNAETSGGYNDPRSSNKKTNITMTARAKSLTTIDIKVNVPRDTTEKNVLHTLRIRNLALSTPQSYSLRDAATVDVMFEIDPFNPLQIKDIMGNSLQFSRLTHCQYLQIQSNITVPQRLETEPVLSTGKFVVCNSSSIGLRLFPSLQCILPLEGIVTVTLKRYEEGSGISSLPTTESNFDGIDLLPGETVKFSLELSSSSSSRLDDHILKQLELNYMRGDMNEDDNENETLEFDENIFGHRPIGPILLTKIFLKFSALTEVSTTWSSLLVDGSVGDATVPEEITLDVIGSLAFAATPILISSQSTIQTVDFSATLSDGNIRSGIFWKCQPLNLPLHLLSPSTLINLRNVSRGESNIRIISSSIYAIPDAAAKQVDISRFICENLCLRATPSSVTVLPSSMGDLRLEFTSRTEADNEDEDISDYSELFEKYLRQYIFQSQKSNATGSSTILALAIIACYDLSFPMHPPLICPIYIKLVAEPQDEVYQEQIESMPFPETPSSPLRKEGSSKEQSLLNGNGAPTLLLRGVTPCLPYVNQFEINLGQQFQSADSTDWTLSLENLSSNTKLRYRISTLSPDDSKWISLAQSGGTINPGGTASLILYFSLKNVGVFATYLIIENLTNPNDTCVVRTSVQVVQDWRKRNIYKGDEGDSEMQQKVLFRIESSQILRDPGLFKETILSWNQLETANRKNGYVRLPCSFDFTPQAAHLIDFGQVFVGQRYTRRSFVIANLSDISLDFQLTSNISPRELSFSLTPVSPRTCYAVTVHPRERRFIYVIFRPLTRENQKPSDSNSKPNSDNFRKFWKIEGSIFVSCNLVKNHHETIKVYAACGLRMFGAFAVKQTNLFPPPAAADYGLETSVLQVSVPEHNDLGLDNLPSEEISAVEGTSLFSGTDYSWHSANNILIRKVDVNSTTPLQIRVYTCMKIFRLEIYRTDKNQLPSQHVEPLPLTWGHGGGENGGATVDFEITSPTEEYIIRVIVNNQEVNSFNEVSKSTDGGGNRYGHYCIGAEDHFMVYNRASPVEKCRIPVRLLIQCGPSAVDPVQEDPIPISTPIGSTLSFSGLEGIIISYLKEFSLFWSDVLSLTNESVIARSDMQQHHSFLRENSGVSTNQIHHTNNFMISMAEHSQNNDYISYGTRTSTDILTALEYFFLRLKYCLILTESEIIPNERFYEYQRTYPDESDIYPIVLSLSNRYLDICFHFGAITDLIVLYSMRQSSFGHEIMTAAHTGLPVGRLALLLYSVVFRHPVFEIIAKIPPEYCREGIGSTLSVPIYPFAKQILYYGSFFSHSNITDGGHDQNPLIDIIKSVKASFIDMKM